MPTISTFVECEVRDSFRVQQVEGMFDLPRSGRLRETFAAEFPGLDEDWTIGAVVGPSGSGKSTLARHAFGDAVWRPGAWPADRAVIDGFGDAPIKDITHTLTAVGLSSPPSWLKPYRVLSGGEKFRCDLARALLGSYGSMGEEESGSVGEGARGRVGAEESKRVGDQETRRLGDQEKGGRSGESVPAITSPSPPLPLAPSSSPLVVFDEFSSVVDRTAARIGAAAVARAIRSGRIQRRFVAVTCHYDVLEWLEVDWHVDLAAGRLERRRLRRPELRLSVVRADAGLWPLFARHHYLSGSLPAASICYVALWSSAGDDESRRQVAGEKNAAQILSPSRPLTPSPPPPFIPAPVAFCAVSNLFGGSGRRRISRLVVLPDFQGVGIGPRLLETVAAHHARRGHTVRITTGHPAMLAYLRRAASWRTMHVYPNTRRHKRTIAGNQVKDAAGRCVASFEFRAEGFEVGSSARGNRQRESGRSAENRGFSLPAGRFPAGHQENH